MQPIDMVLHCPVCGTQHIDVPNDVWTNPPHRTHLCTEPACGHLWRVANVPTNGVTNLKDETNSWLAGTELAPGSKFDGEKPRTDLLDPLALEGLAKVLTFGSIKYAAHNWRGGIGYCRLIGAALRHTFAILRGEDFDPESGLPHVDHLGCCWMFLSNQMKTRPDMDDRWKP